VLVNPFSHSKFLLHFTRSLKKERRGIYNYTQGVPFRAKHNAIERTACCCIVTDEAARSAKISAALKDSLIKMSVYLERIVIKLYKKALFLWRVSL
jgi:hypothetical protein